MLLADSLEVASHPIALTLTVAAAGLSTLWLTRVTWTYWIDVGLARTLGLSSRQKDKVFLNGVYLPVDCEVDTEVLKVFGETPRSLNGVFCRVGPNPYFKPTGDYHV